MTKEKLDTSVKRQSRAKGVSLIKYFDKAKTTSYHHGNSGGDRPTQLLSTCFSLLRVWLERVCLLRIYPFCTKRSGDLEICRYCVTKDKIRLSSLHFCRRACFLFSNFISESVAVMRLSGYPRSIRLALKCEILVLNPLSEEFVRKRMI